MSDEIVSKVRRGRPPKVPAVLPVPTVPTAPEPHHHPRELKPDEQLKLVMDRIAQVTCGGNPMVFDPPTFPTMPLPSAPATPPIVTPAKWVAPIGKFQDIQPNDVVQIVSRESRLYGMTFIVGDVKGDKVHGFYLMPGGRKEYVTVSMADLTNDKGLAVIGITRVKSLTPVSEKWKQDHKI